jgi:hypothetical protein
MRERFATRLADIRPLLQMRPHVPSQAAGMRERFATRLTDVRLLPRMFPHVDSQVVDVSECLAARLTDMRLLPCVGQFVPLKARYRIQYICPPRIHFIWGGGSRRWTVLSCCDYIICFMYFSYPHRIHLIWIICPTTAHTRYITVYPFCILGLGMWGW